MLPPGWDVQSFRNQDAEIYNLSVPERDRRIRKSFLRFNEDVPPETFGSGQGFDDLLPHARLRFAQDSGSGP
jgi:hypothetical protein